MGDQPEVKAACPECGASWAGGQTCQDAFHQMLYWEAEFPPLGVVHHLMVACYHLQHPSIYSPEGLKYVAQLLHDWVEDSVSPQETRSRSRNKVDSGKRTWKITGAAHGNPGSYSQPVTWTMTAFDAIAGGSDAYIERVKSWADSINMTLRSIGM